MAARRIVRIRFRIEALLAVLTGSLTVLTLVWGEWIEEVFHVDPDHGDGSLEWYIVAALALATAAFGVLARVEHRRLLAAR